ncbi:ribosome biogenesis protein BRX1 homolog [Tachypleus tridentatus]|uniref:ribosome biogenesis protein BRX1 homolog n=1 Tax=Tachypleus tridentatus TaxID=6853 RepID=UPI003FD4F805
MARSKAKRKAHVVEKEEKSDPEIKNVPSSRLSDEPPPKRGKWTNKQRVLIFASRGITFRDRHLMQNLQALLPHSKKESKMEKKDSLFVINEICEMKNCNKSIYFENKKRQDLYMWVSNVPRGPSVKFLVQNVHTMEELKLTGNCLKGSRPLLSFDKNFDKVPHFSLLKELLVQVFGTPNHHPRSQPFTDHVFTFSILDNRIWFRNYQIMEEDGSLVEIGPRFVLNPVKIFEGSFGGPVLYSNPKYISPNVHRAMLKKMASGRYKDRAEHKEYIKNRKPEKSYNLDPLDEIFTTIPPEEAKGIAKKTFFRRKE